MWDMWFWPPPPLKPWRPVKVGSHTQTIPGRCQPHKLGPLWYHIYQPGFSPKMGSSSTYYMVHNPCISQKPPHYNTKVGIVGCDNIAKTLQIEGHTANSIYTHTFEQWSNPWEKSSNWNVDNIECLKHLNVWQCFLNIKFTS